MGIFKGKVNQEKRSKFILLMTSKNIDRFRLTIGHLIGRGAFGCVYQALAEGINPKEKLTTVAVKTVRGTWIFVCFLDC